MACLLSRCLIAEVTCCLKSAGGLIAQRLSASDVLVGYAERSREYAQSALSIVSWLSLVLGIA